MRGQAVLVHLTKRKERKERREKERDMESSQADELESWQEKRIHGEYDEAWVVALWTGRYTEKRMGGSV